MTVSKSEKLISRGMGITDIELISKVGAGDFSKILPYYQIFLPMTFEFIA